MLCRPGFESARRQDLVAGDELIGLRGAVEIDRRDAGLGESFDLAWINDAVAVGIDPDAELRVDHVVPGR